MKKHNKSYDKVEKIKAMILAGESHGQIIKDLGVSYNSVAAVSTYYDLYSYAKTKQVCYEMLKDGKDMAEVCKKTRLSPETVLFHARKLNLTPTATPRTPRKKKGKNENC